MQLLVNCQVSGIIISEGIIYCILPQKNADMLPRICEREVHKQRFLFCWMCVYSKIASYFFVDHTLQLQFSDICTFLPYML